MCNSFPLALEFILEKELCVCVNILLKLLKAWMPYDVQATQETN